MNAKLVGAVVVGLVVVAGTVGAFVTDIGTGDDVAGGDGDSEQTYESTVVMGGTDSGGAASGSGGDGSAERLPPFSFNVKKIENCGDTCREVTASITNNQNASRDVTVRSVIYTDGEQIWEGKSDLGTLASGETRTDTKTVKLGYVDAYKVKQNDGEILVKTYVVTEESTYVFTDRRDVA